MGTIYKCIVRTSDPLFEWETGTRICSLKEHGQTPKIQFIYMFFDQWSWETWVHLRICGALEGLTCGGGIERAGGKWGQGRDGAELQGRNEGERQEIRQENFPNQWDTLWLVDTGISGLIKMHLHLCPQAGLCQDQLPLVSVSLNITRVWKFSP